MSPNISSGFTIGNPANKKTQFNEREFAEVRRRVDAQWSRIENYLQEKAPNELKLLNDPASLEQIEALEGELGFMLPNDLRASLLRHNGSARDRVPCGMFILNSVDEVREKFRDDAKWLSRMSESTSRYWSTEEGMQWPSQIVFGDTGLEWVVCVDQITGTVSLRCQHDNRIADSWEHVLIAWMEALEAGDYSLRSDGYISINHWAGLNNW